MTRSDVEVTKMFAAGSCKQIAFKDIENAIEISLVQLYGPIISTNELATILRFSSNHAFRQSVRRGKLKIPLFKLDGRAHRFALAHEVATYLAKQRAEGCEFDSEPVVKN